MPPTMRRRRRHVQHRCGLPERRPVLDCLTQRQPSRWSELRSTVDLHPGPPRVVSSRRPTAWEEARMPPQPFTTYVGTSARRQQGARAREGVGLQITQSTLARARARRLPWTAPNVDRGPSGGGPSGDAPAVDAGTVVEDGEGGQVLHRDFQLGAFLLERVELECFGGLPIPVRLLRPIGIPIGRHSPSWPEG